MCCCDDFGIVKWPFVFLSHLSLQTTHLHFLLTLLTLQTWILQKHHNFDLRHHQSPDDGQRFLHQNPLLHGLQFLLLFAIVSDFQLHLKLRPSDFQLCIPNLTAQFMGLSEFLHHWLQVDSGSKLHCRLLDSGTTFTKGQIMNPLELIP